MQHGVVAKFSRIKSRCFSKIEMSLRVDKFPRLILRSPTGVPKVAILKEICTSQRTFTLRLLHLHFYQKQAAWHTPN